MVSRAASSLISLAVWPLLLLTLNIPVTGATQQQLGIHDAIAGEGNPLPPQPRTSSSSKSKNGVPVPLAEGIETRIIGGDPVTDESEYPFFARWIGCGGSLIHDDIVLSAAHCESTAHPFNAIVAIGGIRAGQGIGRRVVRQISHPLYGTGGRTGQREETLDYDFMVLKLESSALVDSSGNPTSAKTVSLNKERQVPEDNANLVAVGYGRTVTGGSSSDVLRDVAFNEIPSSTCNQFWSSDYYVPDLMICAGVPEGGKGTCQGDSGGPIIDVATDTQVGITSFGGTVCASATAPGVYSRVSAASSWIQEQVCALSDNPPADCPPPAGNSTADNNPPPPGPGQFSLVFALDGAAFETGFSLQHVDSGYLYTFVSFFEFGDQWNNQSATLTLEDMPAGSYQLRVGDQAGNGMCCEEGGGGFGIYDNREGGPDDYVYINYGEFGYYIQVTFDVADDGSIQVVAEDLNYDNSWEAVENVPNYPQQLDAVWPGPMPTSKGSFHVNVKFDLYPYETRWTLSSLQSDGTWKSEQIFDGSVEGMTNQLVVTQFEDMPKDTWYRLTIEDAADDGICCAYRRGWASVTGFARATRRATLIWGTNGDFGTSTQVHFYMSATGYIHDMSEDPPAAAQ